MINNNQISLFPVLERVPFLGPSLRPLQNILSVDFGLLLGSIWGPFGTTCSALLSTSFSDPLKTLHGAPELYRVKWWAPGVQSQVRSDAYALLVPSSSKSIKFASRNDLKFDAFWVP